MVRAHGRLPPVAVRAPHLALTDLGVDRRDAAAVPRELRDRGALRPDVIELEHDGIALSAIDARVCAQEAQDVSQVSVDARIRARPRRLAGRDAPPSSPKRGPAAMAVGANHLTARDLAIDDPSRCRIGEQPRDARDLRPDVVELQDHGVTLAAFHARRPLKVVQEVLAQRLGSRQLRGVRLTTMKRAARPEVRREERPAPPLPPDAEPVEAFRRQVMLAPPTPAQFPREPDRQPSHRKLAERLAERRRVGRRRATHPYADRRLGDAQLSCNAREGPPLRP
jgi:hypothetical protein